MEVFLAAFIWLQKVCVFFQKNIGKKDASKMLMKLTTSREHKLRYIQRESKQSNKKLMSLMMKRPSLAS